MEVIQRGLLIVVVQKYAEVVQRQEHDHAQALLLNTMVNNALEAHLKPQAATPTTVQVS